MATSTKPGGGTTKKKKTSTKTSSKKSSGGGGGGGGNIKKTNDKAQLDALKKLLKSGFKKARNTKLGNIDLIYGQQQGQLLDSYGDKAGSLELSRTDNEKAESDASFANLGNRARESADILSQTAEQGAGETDTLKSQLMAVRNWDSNQADVNRSYFDTVRSVNSAITDLNADTKTAGVNLAAQMLSDKESVWANYYNQRTDAYTQLGNMKANPYSNAYSKKGAKSAYNDMAKEASKAWKNPGVDESVLSWEGSSQAEEGKVNNTQVGNAAKVTEAKRPEGSTLRNW